MTPDSNRSLRMSVAVLNSQPRPRLSTEPVNRCMSTWHQVEALRQWVGTCGYQQVEQLVYLQAVPQEPASLVHVPLASSPHLTRTLENTVPTKS